MLLLLCHVWLFIENLGRRRPKKEIGTLSGYLYSFKKETIVPELEGEKLPKQYYIMRGMPEVVQTWRSTHDIEKVEVV